MAERGRPRMHVQRGARFSLGLIVRPNMPNLRSLASRGSLLNNPPGPPNNPPGPPNRFPPPRGLPEQSFNHFQEDPGGQFASVRPVRYPRCPGMGGADGRPRFPGPRCHQPQVPMPPQGPDYRAQPPPRSQHPTPRNVRPIEHFRQATTTQQMQNFREPRPPQVQSFREPAVFLEELPRSPLIRGNMPRQPVGRGGYRPQNLLPGGENFNQPLQNFSPGVMQSPGPRGRGSSDRGGAFRFPRPPLLCQPFSRGNFERGHPESQTLGDGFVGGTSPLIGPGQTSPFNGPGQRQNKADPFGVHGASESTGEFYPQHWQENENSGGFCGARNWQNEEQQNEHRNDDTSEGERNERTGENGPHYGRGDTTGQGRVRYVGRSQAFQPSAEIPRQESQERLRSGQRDDRPSRIEPRRDSEDRGSRDMKADDRMNIQTQSGFIRHNEDLQNRSSFRLKSDNDPKPINQSGNRQNDSGLRKRSSSQVDVPRSSPASLRRERQSTADGDGATSPKRHRPRSRTTRDEKDRLETRVDVDEKKRSKRRSSDDRFDEKNNARTSSESLDRKSRRFSNDTSGSRGEKSPWKRRDDGSIGSSWRSRESMDVDSGFTERRDSSFPRHNFSKSNETSFQDSDKDSNSMMQIEDEESSKEVLKEEEEEIAVEEKIPEWIRCSPADLYFKRHRTANILVGTTRMQELEKKFDNELMKRASKVRESKTSVELPPRNIHDDDGDNSSDDDDLSSLSDLEDMNVDEKEGEKKGSEDEKEDKCHISWLEELNWKKNHPERLHEEMWFNLPEEMNDGPLCRCRKKAKTEGIRHNIFPGEEPISKCDPHTNNQDKLFHYRITMSPHTNFLTKNPTLVEYDNHEYIFEGFSLFSHYRISKIPLCKVIRFNIEYTIHWFEEDMIENFDVKSLDLFADFLYVELLELFDLDWVGNLVESRCRPFHVMPRFARDLPDNGKEILSMNEVLNFLLRSCRPLLEETELANMVTLDNEKWQDVVDEVRGMIVNYPGMRPSSLRIDQLDREQKDSNVITYPKIIHFGIRPAQLSYAGDPKYRKLWKYYLKLKHLIAKKPKPSAVDREKIRNCEDQLQEMRIKGTMKREMTVEVSSEGFIRTGVKSDICQHALLLPVLIQHLRFHKCLDVLERNLKYTFKDRLFLELALTHPSYRTNYGTNPDHARNSLTNCGFRQLEYGDRQVHYVHRRKKGINVLIHIMAKLGKDCPTPSLVPHYERLEFLGDSVIEFLSSIHLFFMFPQLEEGGLATYRAALVQNQFLTVLAEKIGLQHYMLYAHGPDLCRNLDLKFAMADCFEALMGSLLLDGGIAIVDRIYGDVLFKDEPELHHIWTNLPRHPLQEDEPNGDRNWIALSKPLQKLMEFEATTGVVFNHIRLLARSFTMRNIGYNNLTLGHNQTMEFLGDTILQFLSSEYLYRHFPEHHEGHLTLLRSSLVNHRTQATVCDDLGMTKYIINNDQKVRERMENEKNKVKDKADILEAFLGALYVDQGIESCRVFTEVCFYPRLTEFIINQDWNDAKSQLQQCCLTLREPLDDDPDIPVYKVLQCTGPTNTRKYHVAVYFKGERLGTGIGHSIQRAEMNAATNALQEKGYMFPHFLQVERFLDRRFNRKRKIVALDEQQQPNNDDNSRQDNRHHHHHRHHHHTSDVAVDRETTTTPHDRRSRNLSPSPRQRFNRVEPPPPFFSNIHNSRSQSSDNHIDPSKFHRRSGWRSQKERLRKVPPVFKKPANV